MNLDQFLTALPELTSGVEQIVIATYNALDSHPTGGVFINGKGQEVTILCGGGSYAKVEPSGAWIPNLSSVTMKEVGLAAVSDAAEEVKAGTLVILYAGKSRMEEILQLSYRLTERGIKVVLISCGCESKLFDRVRSNENMMFVIPAHGKCNGGRGDLSDIAEVILK